ncbi:hypothetical protein U1Q18_037360 [Sarracenia purpurea var. burkii]
MRLPVELIQVESLGALQFSLGKTASPRDSIASLIYRSSSGKEGAGEGHLHSSWKDEEEMAQNHQEGTKEKNQGIHQTEDSDLRSMEWVRGGLVSHGSFGTMNLAISRCRSQNQSLQIPPLMAVKSCGLSESALILNEKLILEELGDCPQIIRCFDGDFTFENGEELCNLLLEYASGGALSDKLKNSSNCRLPESEVQRYTTSILEGLHYIHKNVYVHCDIKPQNILLCSSKICNHS